MAKLTLNDLASLANQATAITTINNNNTLIEAAIENTLSRDGSTPNAMATDLDMNGSNRVYNLPLVPATNSDVATKYYVDTLAGILDPLNIVIPSSLFYASGAVINWNAGDVLLTHSANKLAFTGATVGYSFDTNILLATGSTINFNAGDVILTHSAGILTVAPGDLRVTTAGSNAASVALVGGTQTLTNKTLTAPVLTSSTVTTKISPTTDDGAPLGDTTHNFSDLFLATGGVINFANSNYTLTHTSGALTVNGTFTSNSGSAGIGYSAGAGGTVTQITSKATGVTLNKVTGQITMNNASLAAATIVSFTTTCTPCTASDVIIINHISGGTVGSYIVNAQAQNGQFVVNIRNTTAGALAEALVLSFAIVRSTIT